MHVIYVPFSGVALLGTLEVIVLIHVMFAHCSVVGI